MSVSAAQAEQPGARGPAARRQRQPHTRTVHREARGPVFVGVRDRDLRARRVVFPSRGPRLRVQHDGIPWVRGGLE